MRDHWWDTFFISDLWLEVQRNAWSDEDTRTQAERIEQLTQLKPPARVLDVPCGEGRLSIELAQLGYAVTGVDVTQPLIEIGQRKAHKLQLEVTFKQGDMRELPWESSFDAVICYWGSFGYFDELGNAKFLQAVLRALKPGGRLLIDTHTAETLFPRYQERGWRQVGEVLVLEDRQWDHLKGRINVSWTFVSEGQIDRRFSSIRVYTYRELTRLLKTTGFSEYVGYSSLEGEPFRIGASRLVIVATKPTTA